MLQRQHVIDIIMALTNSSARKNRQVHITIDIFGEVNELQSHNNNEQAHHYNNVKITLVQLRKSQF